MSDVRTMLVVEDNVQDEMLVMRALRRANLAHQVDVVGDGQQALDYLFGEGDFAGRTRRDPPSVILLDINLPRINGLDVLQRLRADPRTRLLPIVLLTSSDEDRDRLCGYERGANSFVRKSVDFVEFSETLARVSTYWLAVNEPPPVRGHNARTSEHPGDRRQ